MRNFFLKENFLDIMAPIAVENPGMEVHIHPFQLYSVKDKKTIPQYLHTSPEFFMKDLLSRDDFDNIFTINFSFRDEPSSPIHRSQFLMLEWYRKNHHYKKIMDDVENLISYTLKEGLKILPLNGKVSSHHLNGLVVRKTMQEIFLEVLQIDILEFLTLNSIKELLRQFPEVPLPSEETPMEWDDYFFLLYLNKIEPFLTQYPYLIIYEFPSPLSALSTLKKEDPRVCERFELYINGVEICNCFNELTDLEEQQKRFNQQTQLKKKYYGYQLPEPHFFYQSLKRGLPSSCGIALGVERFFSSLFQDQDIFIT